MAVLRFDFTTVITLLALLPLLYIYTAYVASSQFPTLKASSILLLIAHPDDEAMFFAPTVVALTRPELGNHLKILCLTTGDADGLGHVRKKEIVHSARLLGLRSDEDVLVLEDPRFVDSITAPLPEKDLRDLLVSTFAPKLSKTPKTKAPQTTIDALITFDAQGVSNHPNHRSCSAGARAFVQEVMRGREGWQCPVDLYELTSVGIARKYAGILDAMVSVISAIVRTMFSRDKVKSVSKRSNTTAAADRPSWILAVSGPRDYTRAVSAMTSAHKSQMVWFRWGWISLSRYMVVNELRRVKV